MGYDPDGESHEEEYENRVRRTIKRTKMSRKKLHTIFWITLLISSLITYLIMFFMGNPFSDITGMFVKGESLVWVISTIILWWINATVLFFATKWYMSDYWYLKHWFTYIISTILVIGLYYFNRLTGMWTFIVLGLLAGALVLVLGEYIILDKVIKSINRNTINDDPIYYDEEYVEKESQEKKN